MCTYDVIYGWPLISYAFVREPNMLYCEALKFQAKGTPKMLPIVELSTYVTLHRVARLGYIYRKVLATFFPEIV